MIILKKEKIKNIKNLLKNQSLIINLNGASAIWFTRFLKIMIKEKYVVHLTTMIF
jgi:hypothetical protein